MADEGRVDALTNELRAVLTQTQQSRQHAPAVSSMLDDSLEAVATLHAHLEKLQQFVVLDEVAAALDPLSAARELWAEMRPGDSVGELSHTSPVLSALTSTGAEILGATPFTDAELHLAEQLGHDGAEIARPLAALARGESGAVDARAVRGLQKALAELEKSGAFSGATIEAGYEAGDDVSWTDPDSVPNDSRILQWRVSGGSAAPEWQEFVAGGWVGAYAYHVVNDQFARTTKPYEIYTSVEIGPPDHFPKGCTLDLIAHSEDQTLVLTNATTLPDTAESAAVVAKDITFISTLLTEASVGGRHTYAVLTESAAPELESTLSDHAEPIAVVACSATRPLAQKVAQGHEVGPKRKVPGSYTGPWLKAISNGQNILLKIEDGGTLTEQHYFNRTLDSWGGHWRVEDGQLIMQIGDWTATMEARTPERLVGVERGPQGENRIMLMRLKK